MPNDGRKALSVDEDIWEKLSLLKIKMRKKRMNDVIDELLAKYESDH